MRYAPRMPLDIPNLVNIVRRVRHGLTLGVRVIAHDADGRLLLVRHTYVPGWHFPGGGVDVGETAEAAARRELREEANVEVLGPLAFAGLFFYPRIGRRDHVALFRAADITAGAPPGPSREIAQVAYFAPADLPEDLSAATRRRLEEAREGLPPSDVW